MKHLLKYSIYLFATLIISCTTDPAAHRSSEMQESNTDRLIIEQAKYFFENDDVSNIISTRAESPYSNNVLTPGDFTPLWNHASVSQHKQSSNVEIPILPQYKYKIIRSHTVNGIAHAHDINIVQKLIISKSKRTGKMGSYIKTLIPDTHYDHCTNKFSGWSIISIPPIKKPIIAEYYKDGQLKMKFSLLASEISKSSTQISAFYKFIREQKIMVSQRSYQTRSFGEDDDWGWDDDDYYDDYDYYDNFADWFLNEVWPELEDGDSFTMKEDENGNWFLEDNNDSDNKYYIPDYLVDDSSLSDDWDNDWDNGWNDDNDDDFLFDYVNEDVEHTLYFGVYHKKCGTLLGVMAIDDFENRIFYCPTCKEYVYFYY